MTNYLFFLNKISRNCDSFSILQARSVIFQKEGMGGGQN